MMKGEFDSHLKWPFKGDMEVQLVNQREGGVNYERKICSRDYALSNFERVPEGEVISPGWGLSQFISQADLQTRREHGVPAE